MVTTTELIINILSGKKVSLTSKQIGLVLELSKYNKVALPIAKKLLKYKLSKSQTRDVRKIIKIGHENIRLQAKTIRQISKTLSSKFDYKVMRTRRSVEYITFDIDLLVKSSKQGSVVRAFEKDGLTSWEHGVVNGIRRGWQVNVRKNGQMLIDIHRNVSWLGSVYISETDFWKHKKRGVVAGVNTFIPDPETELLLISANVLFEKFHLTIVDHLYLRELKDLSSMERVLKIAKKHGWDKYLQKLMNEIDGNNTNIFMNRQEFPKVIRTSHAIGLIVNRIIALRGISFLAIAYTTYLYMRIIYFKEKFFPYYFSPTKYNNYIDWR